MKKCVKCKEKFSYSPEDCKWNYDGTEPVKIVTCPNCQCLNAVKYEQNVNPNTDDRFYFYKK